MTSLPKRRIPCLRRSKDPDSMAFVLPACGHSIQTEAIVQSGTLFPQREKLGDIKARFDVVAILLPPKKKKSN